MDWGTLVVVGGTALALWLVLHLAARRAELPEVAWLAGHSVPLDEATVYARYLDRHRRHRTFGGLLGVALAAVVGFQWYATVRVGIGMGNPLGDVLFCGLGGVIAGALSAETFRFSRVASPHVTASLAEHRTQAPPTPHAVVLARWFTAAAILVAALALPATIYPALSAVGGLVMVGMAEATRLATVRRRRPVLSDRARVVDARMRTFALGVLANLELGAAVLAAGWTIAGMPGWDNGVGALARGLLTWVAFAWAVALLLRARVTPAGFVAAA